MDQQSSLLMQKQTNNHFWLASASLLCSFAVWMFWSVASVMMLQLGFSYSAAELFSLITIAGLAGGTARIGLGFGVVQNDQRLMLFVLVLLIVPVIVTGMFLQQATPLWVLQVLALVSGLGGGFFSAFISQMRSLFSRAEQTEAISLGAGLGHLGIVASFILLPLLATFTSWGWLNSEPLVPVLESSTLLGARASSDPLWIQHMGYVWLLLLVPLIILLINVSHYKSASTSPGVSWLRLLWRVCSVLLFSFVVSALGAWLILPTEANGSGFELSPELMLSVVIISTLMFVRLQTHRVARGLHHPHAIFNNKHTWVMSALSVMSLGTFLGFSAALPLTLQWVFGYSHSATEVAVNVNAPGVFTYVWMCPLLGITMRPLGNWMALRLGGARTTQYCTLVLLVAAIGLAYYLHKAYHSAEPEQYFLAVLLWFLALFAAAGAAHAAISHMIQRVFPSMQSPHITLWLSAIAAYGVFYIPQLLGEQLMHGTPAQAMIGFTVFYAVCLLLNGWFYLRRDSVIYNP